MRGNAMDTTPRQTYWQSQYRTTYAALLANGYAGIWMRRYAQRVANAQTLYRYGY